MRARPDHWHGSQWRTRFNVSGFDGSPSGGSRQSADSHVETFNLAFPGLDCDEGEYVIEANGMWKTLTTRVTFSLPSAPEFEASLLAHQDFPDCPNGVAHYPLYRMARDRGCRVLLGGLGGDDCFTGHYLHLADLLRRLKLVSLGRQLRDDGLDLRALLRFAVRPLAPEPLRRVARAMRPGYPDWIPNRFATHVNLPDRLYRGRFSGRFNGRYWQSRAQEGIFRDITSGWTAHVHETLSRILSEHTLEYRSPLMRLKVVEFALAIPEEQRWRGSVTKFVFRQAMRDLLPEKIRARPDKPDFGILFPSMLRQLNATSVFGSLRIAALGWVDAAKVNEMHAALLSCPSTSYIGKANLWPLWMIFGVERWLTATDALFERKPTWNLAS